MLSDIEAELEREVRDLRAELIRERRARELRTEIGRLVAETSSRITRSGVAAVLTHGVAEVFDTSFVTVAFVDDDSMVRLEHGPGVPDGIVGDGERIPLDADVPICRVLRGEHQRLELSDEASFRPWPVLAGELERSGIRSLVVSAVGDRDEPDAALLVGWPDARLMDTAESELFGLLASLAAPAFERARRTESDDELARAVQRWLREGALADVPGFDVATLYEPGRDLLRVGGDWFDVVEMADGSAAIVVGDVVGHDVRAAIEMSQVRHVVASHLITSGSPVEALTTTDRYLRRRAPQIMATALVATFDRDGRVALAAAGHPPPIMVDSTGRPRLGRCGLGPPLGTGIGGYSSGTEPMAPGEVLVAYTDGVVERRDELIDNGIDRLQHEIAEAVRSTGATAESVVAHLTRIVDQPWRTDDAAAVVVRLAAVGAQAQGASSSNQPA